MTDSDFNNADTAQLVGEFRDVTTRLRSEVGRIIVGQDEVVEHLLKRYLLAVIVWLLVCRELPRHYWYALWLMLWVCNSIVFSSRQI